jgi:hypothetical protein
MPRPRNPATPFRYFHSSPEVIRMVLMLYVRYPLLLRNVEDLLFERGIDLCHEAVRLWWNRFGPVFAADIRRQPVSRSSWAGQRRWSVIVWTKSPCVSPLRLRLCCLCRSRHSSVLPSPSLGPLTI